MGRLKSAFLPVLFLTFIAALFPSAGSSDELSFFRGKKMIVVVAANPGSTYDFYSRAFAPVLGRNLSLSTSIVANTPGAGGARGATRVYKALPDGLTIGTFTSGVALLQLTGARGVNFDVNKFTWMCNMARMPRVLIVRADSPFRSLEDLKNPKVAAKLPTSGAASAAQYDALMLNEIFGLKIQPIPGYGGSESAMAWERGEINMRIGSIGGLQQHIAKKEARILVRITAYPDKDFAETYPELLGVPSVTDLAPANKKGWANFMNVMADLARPLAGPPGIPSDRVKLMREMIKKSFSDPELIKMTNKANMPLYYQSADDVEKMLQDVRDAPEDLINFLKRITKK